MDTAAELIAELGIAGLRVDEVARRAQVNKRMIYHYFGSKKGLWAQVLDRHVEYLCSSVTELSDGSKNLLRAEFVSSPQTLRPASAGLVEETVLQRAAKIVLRRFLDGPGVRAGFSDADWRDLFLVLCRLTLNARPVNKPPDVSEHSQTSGQDKRSAVVNAKPTYQLSPNFRVE
tara:strand:- start:123 stop:644 length:522 start_codon:yes stop_codon:yes gene_type:complete